MGTYKHQDHFGEQAPAAHDPSLGDPTDQLGPPLSPFYEEDPAAIQAGGRTPIARVSDAEIRQRRGERPAILPFDAHLATEPIVTIMGRDPQDREKTLYSTVMGMTWRRYREARRLAGQGRQPEVSNIIVARYGTNPNDQLVHRQHPNPWYDVIQTTPWGLLHGLSADQLANVLAAAVGGGDTARERDVAMAIRPICDALSRTPAGLEPERLRQALAYVSEERPPLPEDFGLPPGIGNPEQILLDAWATIPMRKIHLPHYLAVGSLLDLVADTAPGQQPTVPRLPGQSPNSPPRTTVIVAGVTSTGASGRAQADLLTSALEVMVGDRTLWQQVGALAMVDPKDGSAPALRGIAEDSNRGGKQVVTATASLAEELWPIAARGALALSELDRDQATTAEGLLDLRRRERVTGRVVIEAGTEVVSGAASLTDHKEAGARIGSSGSGSVDLGTNLAVTSQTSTEVGDLAAADAAELQTIRARLVGDKRRPEVLVIRSDGVMHVYDLVTRQPLRAFPPKRERAPDVSVTMKQIRARHDEAVTNAEKVIKTSSPVPVGRGGTPGIIRVPEAQVIAFFDKLEGIPDRWGRFSQVERQWRQHQYGLQAGTSWQAWVDWLYNLYRASGRYTGSLEEWQVKIGFHHFHPRLGS